MHHEMEAVLQTIVVAIFLGILAQVVAHRFKLPAILPLLLAGMAAGPYGLKLFDPAALGPVLEVIIHLGVAVILFEGGLSLDPRQLRQVSGSIRNLLLVGSFVTLVGAAWLAHELTAISWSTAALFGAIVTVTGPTVIAPLLRHMIAPRRVRTILLSEGLMIDPIGAVLAYLVLQWIERSSSGLGLQDLGIEILTLFATGAVLGYVAGALSNFVVRYRHMAEELRNLVILALLLLCFMVAEHEAPQSGIVAAVVMGFTMSAARAADLNPLKHFKGQLTVLIISVLFILLSGQLDLTSMGRLGWRGLAVVAGLIFLVRPLAVLLSIPRKELDWKEKTVLAFSAPRGIVAAAVASLSAIQLRSDGASVEAATLEGLVYLVILVTCTWATVMASLLPRLLGYVGDPSRRRIVIVGAHLFTARLARLWQEQGWTTVVIDGAPGKLGEMRRQKITGVRGDARDASTYEEAGLERDSLVLALTPNDELNLLVAELVREEFSIEHPVVALHQRSAEFGQQRRAWVDLFCGRELDIAYWSHELAEGDAELVTETLDFDDEKMITFRAMLREEPENLFMVCGWLDGAPVFRWSSETLGELDKVTLLVRKNSLETFSALMGPEDSISEVDLAKD